MKRLIKGVLGRIAICAGIALPRSRRILKSIGLRCSQDLFRNRAVSIPISNRKALRLTNVDNSYLAFQLFWHGFQYYEPITCLLLREILRPGATFLDIGAHHGFFSLAAGLLGEGIHIVAFEPNPGNFRILKANVAANGVTNLRIEPLAISDSDGMAALYLTKSDMSASLMQGFQSHDTKQVGSVQVPTVTLDHYLQVHAAEGPLVIKVDIEGHEAAFIRGARKTIGSFKPDIVLEVVEDQDPLWVADLKSMGYRFYSITDRGLVELDAPRLAKRFPFLFLNHLLSIRPKEEIGEIFKRLEPRVRGINLLETSKHFRKEEWPLLWQE
jgi:FkbM family methyltransferase